ncbi:uncharacterized protein BT62DRAFT_954313 [Guyanagaster necrorhizus]|uniref:Uncharacterized protein n=1 Tax=Guyanagaster necrorhizus TaxID=856835 RepID=A0A9P8APE6_9AGAR|nr:uncharacterized protein BT62DRAFT_954313 [Guyanagaster necrorhizus MCA 3950]KAG7442865.1 hypothetical protein BT62DRAFT_954313 [Guyanagaster necrorhizus MCA 3950]
MDPLQAAVLQQFFEYPFEIDQTYQQGLAGILANNPSNTVLLNTRVFYFNRLTGSSITVADVLAYKEQSASASESVPPSNSAANDSKEQPNVLTFAQLQELIESGRLDEIPNNKTISGELNSAPPSQSAVSVRRKPWETSNDSSNIMES